MEFSGLSTYRSEGLGVNKTDNMVRVTVFATRNEWRRMLSAVQNIERRKTVRAKRPVQQLKVSTVHDDCKSCGNKSPTCYFVSDKDGICLGWYPRTAKTV